MEYDRYQNNHKLYLLGMASLLCSLVFLSFATYILPYLIWNLHYKVPYVVIYLLANLQEDYLLSPWTSKFLVAMLFIVPGLIAGFLSYYASNKIENKLFQVPEAEETEQTPQQVVKKNEERRESVLLTVKILFFMVLLLLAILFIQSLIL